MHLTDRVDGYQLPTGWLAAMPDLVARLESVRHPRIADLGCGQGFSTLALADAFLDSHVDGLDTDPTAIADARRRAAAAGLDGRVRFLHAGATELTGSYDLIVAAPHHVPDLATVLRAALAPDGTVLVVDDNDFLRLS